MGDKPNRKSVLKLKPRREKAGQKAEAQGQQLQQQPANSVRQPPPLVQPLPATQPVNEHLPAIASPNLKKTSQAPTAKKSQCTTLPPISPVTLR